MTLSFFNNTSRRHVISYHPQFAHVFLCLNNSSSNKWFEFKIPSWNVYTIIPFPTCSPTRYLRPIMPEFYHVLAYRRMFSLQFNQYSQAFNQLPQSFPQHFEYNLDCPIPQLQVSFDACAHIPSTLWVSISYIMPLATNAQKPMMQFTTPLLPLCGMLVSMWGENNYMCFLQTCSTPFVDKSTLCSPKMAFAPQLTLSLLTQHE